MRPFDHMQRALESLPDDAREALRLRYDEGLPTKEIAKRLGRSDGAIRVLLTRSKQTLNELGHAFGSSRSVDESSDGEE